MDSPELLLWRHLLLPRMLVDTAPLLLALAACTLQFISLIPDLTRLPKRLQLQLSSLPMVILGLLLSRHQLLPLAARRIFPQLPLPLVQAASMLPSTDL